jgi:NAD(P)-dependent dehydrogenase (short-subunit alcohol dehydrogenase family)
MNTFANQVILITGAASGIGRQLALDLAPEGAAVAAVDLQAEPLAALASEMSGKRFAWASGDVTDRTLLQNAVNQVVGQLGPIDVLIASAGIGRENSALAFRAEDFEAQIRVNLIGVANSVEAVLPGMIERHRGHLVALSSLASYRGLPKMLGYCASKSGVNALMEGLRVELQPLGIHVTTLCPGWIRTPMTANINLPPDEVMDLPSAAREILQAIRDRRSYHAFPRKGVRQMRLLRWLPCSWSDQLTRKGFRRLDLQSGGQA